MSYLRGDAMVGGYGGADILHGCSIGVDKGEIAVIVGPNGAGKTTTFYMIVGFVKPNDGQVFLDQQDITKLAMYKRARLGIGYLPQEASVFRKLVLIEIKHKSLQFYDHMLQSEPHPVQSLKSGW